MSDFEDFEELFAKEADHNITKAEREIKEHDDISDKDFSDEDEQADNDILSDEIEHYENSSEINAESVELDEYLIRKIHHLCISLSSFSNNKFDITATTLSNLKQLKQGLQFDSKKLESHTVFIQLYKNNLLVHDLIPILGLYNCHTTPSEYLNKCVVRALEIIYKITTKIELNEHSSIKEVEEYNEVKKIQLVYKKQLLNVNTLKSFVKLLMINSIVSRTIESEISTKITIFVINIIKNMLEIEPFEMIVSGEKWKKLKSKQLNLGSGLPKGVTQADINIQQTVDIFDESGLFPILIKITQSLGNGKHLFDKSDDEERIYLPIMDIWFNLIKDLSPKKINNEMSVLTKTTEKKKTQSHSESKFANLLSKDKELRKKIANNTSSRHSKFGSLITVETGDSKRTQVTSINNSSLADKAMDFLDNNKKSLPKMGVNKADNSENWIKSTYLISLIGSESVSSLAKFNIWIDKFIFCKGFINLMTLITTKLKEDGFDESSDITCKFLILSSWFIEYHYTRREENQKFMKLLPKIINIGGSGFIKLVFEMYTVFGTEKHINHCIVHAFNRLYILILNIITEDNNAKLTYYAVVIYILKHLDLHNSMYTYTRLLQNSSNIILQESSIILNTNLVKLNSQLSNFNINYSDFENSSRTKHNVNKLAKLLNFSNLDDTLKFINNSFLDTDAKQNFGLIFHPDTVSTVVVLLESYSYLSYNSQKNVLKFLNICQKTQPTALQRFDVLLQLRQISKNTLKNSRLFQHISAFSKDYLHLLKNRLLKNPKSAPIELLFVRKNSKVNELYKDNEFLTSGELSKQFVDSYLCVKISKIKEEILITLEALTPVEALKNKFGMIIGSLVERDNLSLIECVLDHLKNVKVMIVEEKRNEAALVLNDRNNNKNSALDKATKKNSDFRLFLTMLGYEIPNNINQLCCLPKDVDMSKLNFNITIIVTFIENPLELNDISSMYSLFERFDEKKTASNKKVSLSDEHQNRDDDYEDDEGFVVSDDDNYSNDGNQDQYFRQLIQANVKKVEPLKNQKKHKKTMKKASTKRSEKQKAKKSTIVSKALLSSSSDDDEEENENDIIFFENELYSKFVTLLHNGQLSAFLQSEITRFRDLRAKKQHFTVDSFEELFKGEVPKVSELNSKISEFNSPMRTENFSTQMGEYDDINENKEMKSLQLTQLGVSESDTVRLGRINKLREVMGKLTGTKTQRKGLLHDDEDEEEYAGENLDNESENEEDEFEKGVDEFEKENFDRNLTAHRSKTVLSTEIISDIDSDLLSKQVSYDSDLEDEEETVQPLKKKRKVTVTEEDE
ncbi:hypothetical protein QEN19_002909 [Hanseniaspora menglaensis]